MSAPLNFFYNFHWVTPGEAARSAQPYAGMWRWFLRGNGIKAVVNLRGAHPDWHWWRVETRICRDAGIAHYDFSLNSRNLPGRDLLAGIVETMAAAPKPLMIKCSGGQDRTSLTAALYLVHRFGWGHFEDACRQFSRWPYLHFPKRHQRWLRLFMDFAKHEANGKPLLDWLKTDYDRNRLAAWLKAGGHAGTFKGFHRL
jgi:hypothetical protein